MAIIIHAVQKLLNMSRLQAGLFITKPSENQELHSWYAKLIPTTFRGKLLVMYVHEPSLIIVLIKGKTITGTLPEFYTSLEALLMRNNFENEFIKSEIALAKNGYVVSRTNNKSILGSMNAMSENINYRCSTFSGYDNIDLNYIEDAFMDWLTCDAMRPNKFRRSSDYWKEKGLIKS